MMKKIRFDASKAAKFISKSGFYIALSLCLVAVGAVTFSAFNNSTLANLPEQPGTSSAVSSRPQYSYYEQTQQVQQKTESVLVESSKAPSKPQSKKSSEGSDSKKLSYAFPCGNTILLGYSDNELIYNKTMCDWRSHNAVDLSAAKGEEIKAIADGKVTEVTDDYALGGCITIEHGGKVTAKYCGLSQDTDVKKGDRVKMGQKIGTVEAVPFEADSEHLHLEIYINGRVTDPLDYLGRTINNLALGNED